VHSDPTTAYLRWTFLRAALARGWWLTAALYLVVVADLSPVELILIGVFQGLTVLVAEVPAGVVADAVSRRLVLVWGHVVMGAGMAMTGVVGGFPLLVVSQCLWGLGWAISSGADVAWITDELDRTDRIDRVLTAQGRFDLLGAPAGIIGCGALAWATSLATAIVAAGVAMAGLGLLVVARWPESRRPPGRAGSRREATMAVVRQGRGITRAEPVIVAVLAATLLIHGGFEGFGRLFERRLIGLGMPQSPDPILWFAAVAVVGASLGATMLLWVEARITGTGVARRTYGAACAIGTVGLVVFAHAPNALAAVVGALLVRGLSLPAVRVAGTILVNRRTTSDARATVHSLLSQAENLGEVVFGLVLAAVASGTSPTATLVGSAVLFAVAGLLLGRTAVDDDRPPPAEPDPIFSHPRLAGIYDVLDDDRSDLDHHLALVDELGARSVLDVGCGTGVFACLLAAHGRTVTGLDPADASLAVARRKPHADRVTWRRGEASGAPGLGVDLVTMTGNVAQVFLTDVDWSAALHGVWGALRPGGHLVFEVRDPARRAWESWNRQDTARRVVVDGIGAVDTWIELTSVAPPLVSFRHVYEFASDGATLTSDSTLRFRERDEIVAGLDRVGFRTLDVRDAPDRPGLEWVFVARRPGGG
jgi:SAM-dependent methyltransferase